MRVVSSADEALCEGDSGGSGASDKSTSASEDFRGLKSLSTEDLELGIEKNAWLTRIVRVEDAVLFEGVINTR